MGLIYQFYNLIPVLNVTENITLPVLMDGRKVNEKRLQELIATLKLEGREQHLPNQLSGGQQQRVSIGRALMNAPAVVLADEPTGNLDSKNSQEIIELLRYSNKKYGQTLIVITHDENIALQADRIIAIEDGKITRDEVIQMCIRDRTIAVWGTGSWRKSAANWETLSGYFAAAAWKPMLWEIWKAGK